MFRILPLFIATLLLFNMMPVSLAQQNDAQAQTKADALGDVKRDMKESLWFTLGLVGSSAGTVTGCASGVLVALLIDFDLIPIVPDAPDIGCVLAGTILFGVLAVPISVYMYPHSPSPPPERLLGKTPEYVAAYTQAYRSKAISLRKKLVTAGSITSNLGFFTLLMMNSGL